MTLFDESLVRSIINRCVALALRDHLGLNNVDYDAKRVEYCPMWKWNREEKKRQLRSIQVRLAGSDKFLSIHKGHTHPTGLHLTEMLEYLDKSDATRVTIGSI
jgi:hypothetical protein